MAPLKFSYGPQGVQMVDVYPWLRGHGSIEVTSAVVRRPRRLRWYPWLRGHGSIEVARSEGEPTPY